MGTEEEREPATNTGCQGKTKSGEPCGNKVRRGQLFCYAHRYQKHKNPVMKFLARRLGSSLYSPTVGTALGILLALFFGYFTMKSPTKEEIVTIAGEATARAFQEYGLAPAKTAGEIKDALGLTCTEALQVLCSKIDAASAALGSGRYADAEKMYDALVEMFPNVANLQFNLAYACDQLGNWDKAASKYQKVLLLNPDDAASLNNLGAIYYRQGLYSKAQAHLQRALAIFEKALGPKHPDLDVTLNNLGLLYIAQGQYAQAEPLYNRLLRTKEIFLGPNHPSMAVSLILVARLYRTQGKFTQAELLYQRALAISTHTLGKFDYQTIGILEELQALYQEMNQPDSADVFAWRIQQAERGNEK